MIIYTDVYIVCWLIGGIVGYYWNVLHLCNLIKLYFVLWLKRGEILQFLKTGDDIILSVRTVRQILQSMRLYRRKIESDPLEVASFLTDQLGGGVTEGFADYSMQHLIQAR